MSLQYLDALKALGTGPATKFIVPMEFTQLLKPFVTYASQQAGENEVQFPASAMSGALSAKVDDTAASSS